VPGLCLVILAGLMISPYGKRARLPEQKRIDSAFHVPLPTEQTPLSQCRFIAFDTETTGVNPNYARVVEIAAVKFDAEQVLDERTWLVNPERFIPREVQGIHGITPDMIRSSPVFGEIYPEFAEYVAGSVLIAHNALFDVNFVSMETSRLTVTPPPNPVVDCLKLFRNLYPGLESYSLEAVAAHVRIPTEILHRAVDDSRYTAKVIIEVFGDLGEDPVLGELYESAGGRMAFGEWP
jgi:DNA polymerase III epsilon subunit family exonuclease